MNKKIKIIASIITALALLVAGVVVADYFKLLGTTTNTYLDFIEVRVRTLDKANGNLIVGAGVRCYSRHNINACTLRDSHQAGIVAVHIPYRRIVESSLFFTKNEEIKKPSDKNINIIFIHNDYLNTHLGLNVDEMFENSGKEYVVKMPARDWGVRGAES